MKDLIVSVLLKCQVDLFPFVTKLSVCWMNSLNLSQDMSFFSLTCKSCYEADWKVLGCCALFMFMWLIPLMSLCYFYSTLTCLYNATSIIKSYKNLQRINFPCWILFLSLIKSNFKKQKLKNTGDNNQRKNSQENICSGKYKCNISGPALVIRQ